jgi:hypothetical protein
MKTYVQLDFENNALSNGFLQVEYMDWFLDWIVMKLKFSP